MEKEKEGMAYKDFVDYDNMDPFKRLAQQAARTTTSNLKKNYGFKGVEESRGESVYLTDLRDFYLAHVEEGLGTKNLVADAMYKLTGKSYYNQIAQDTVAMIVNDMITLGAVPISVAMHLAVGSSDWFKDEKRCSDLIEGWKKSCDLAGCIWAGGETPTLKDTFLPNAVVLAGSATGIIRPKSRMLSPDKIRSDDAIVLLSSSGIHANGLTMAREIAKKTGYDAKLSDGRMYGEALLDPTCIYVQFIDDCLNSGADIHYTVNITGHGWRKLMRAPQPFAYILSHIFEPQPVFQFIQKHGPVSDRAAYADLNMGAGFAIYVSRSDVGKIWDVAHARSRPFEVLLAGHVEASANKKVVITEKNLEFGGETLGVR
jgi:phosphoribosylformylglycinamidine cyclo-ligase